MKSSFVFLAQTSLVIQFLVLCASQDFDFFYFVQQWPGSYCDTKKSCCYPTTGKPVADFGIHGLWPNYNDGSYPTNCDPDSLFNASAITDLKARMQRDWPTLACPSSDGIEFWSHEWEKHGTCTVLDEHAYFEKTLMLKKQIDLLTILRNAGIIPNGSFYSLNSISNAIAEATGFTPLRVIKMSRGIISSTRFTCVSTLRHRNSLSALYFPGTGVLPVLSFLVFRLVVNFLRFKD